MEKWAFETVGMIQKHYGLPSHLYSEYPDSPRISDMWSAGIQLSALNAAAKLDPSRLPAAEQYADALKAYETHDNGYFGYSTGTRGGERYYDDNEWILLDLIDTYELSHAPRFLRRAEKLMQFIASGESQEFGGGIYWREVHRDSKNTCSNAPAICGALRLYQFTHDKKTFALAQRLYAWTNSHLQDTDGLYFDHIAKDGSISKTKFTYNTALMLRANCLFYQVTKDKKYLDEAERIAAAAEKRWFRPSDGAMMDDSQFAHLLSEALLDLSDIDHDQQRIDKVRRALVYLHDHLRLPNGLYPKRWDTPAGPGYHDFALMFEASAARGYAEFAIRH